MGTVQGKATSAASLGLLLQQGRLAAGLTQRELAEKLGTTQSYIWALESGKDVKVLDRIFAMMKATGVTMQIAVPND